MRCGRPAGPTQNCMLETRRIVTAMLVLLATSFIVFLPDATDARKQSPTDQITQTLEQAGLKQLEQEAVRQIGEAIEVGAPLRLDQRTAYPPTAIENFQPKVLDLTPEGMNQPLDPGDYSIPVIGYCTKWSLHYPGRGLPYKLAALQGRHAAAIGALLDRGTLRGINPRTLKAMAWRIQGGLPLSRWRSQERELLHQLIPEYEGDLDGDFLEQTRAAYEQARTLAKLPPFEKTLASLGPPGVEVLDLLRARKILAHQTLAAERMPDLLYGRPRDGLPKTLQGGPSEPPSPWSEIRPGVFARVTIIKGDIGNNVLDLRITPQASKPFAASSRGRQATAVNYSQNAFAVIPAMIYIEEDQPPKKPHILDELFWYIHGLIAYPEGRPAQALILVPHVMCTSVTNCGFIGIRG